MKKFFITGLIVIALLVIAFAGFPFATSPSWPSGPPLPLTIGIYPEIINTLLYIADDRGFFLDNGLNVTIRSYDSGMAASEAMERGEIELAALSEYAFVGQAFQNPAIAVIASQDKSQRFYIISQEGRGIVGIQDLSGKRIGIACRTAAEFYLGRFLMLHGIGFRNVTIADIKPRDSVDAFRAGKIDAFVAERTAVEELRCMPDGPVISWPAQGNQPSFNLVAGRRDWIAGHPELVAKFLRALDTASEYAAGHPAEAQMIVKKRLNLTDAYTTAVWPDHQFSLSLDQSLVFAMEDEARWMIANNLTNTTKVPDFRPYILTDGLESVKSGSVNII
jgi:NitT/TauT family transport system substrate-binding protein